MRRRHRADSGAEINKFAAKPRREGILTQAGCGCGKKARLPQVGRFLARSRLSCGPFFAPISRLPRVRQPTVFCSTPSRWPIWQTSPVGLRDQFAYLQPLKPPLGQLSAILLLLLSTCLMARRRKCASRICRAQSQATDAHKFQQAGSLDVVFVDESHLALMADRYRQPAGWSNCAKARKRLVSLHFAAGRFGRL